MPRLGDDGRYPSQCMNQRLVQVERLSSFDEHRWYGYVVSSTDSFLLLQVVSDRYDLDGYRCIRQADISSIAENFSRKDFVQRALRCKGLNWSLPRVRLVNDIREMMKRIESECELVTIHRELVCPDECEIGRVREIDRDTYTLDWITPNGEWEEDDRPFRYSDITRLDFADEYSRTLLMVYKDRNIG